MTGVLKSVDETSDEIVGTLKAVGEETVVKLVGQDVGEVSRELLGAGKTVFDTVKSIKGVDGHKLLSKTVEAAAKEAASSYVQKKKVEDKLEAKEKKF